MAGKVFTAIGTPNIALVKYWGKRDGALNLPTNSSISITLDETLSTRTSVIFSDKLNNDALYINGKLQDLKDQKNEKSVFTAKALDRMRMLAGEKSKALIVSSNSFVTSGGLASSASGGATLVYAVSKALGLGLSQKELSVEARRISGSACRSLFGGFVAWNKGANPDGSDSYAEQLADENHWSEVTDVITLVSADKKKVSSSDGHRASVETSALYSARPAIAEDHIAVVKEAIRGRDFAKLARITMQDSDSMHAIMLDSYPPIIYLNDVSKRIIDAVLELNASRGEDVAAYTFDAGPNAHIITLAKDKEAVAKLAKSIVGDNNVIVAGQGNGPRMLGAEDSLIDESVLGPK